MKQLIACKKLVLLTTLHLLSFLPIEAQNVLQTQPERTEDSLADNSKLKGAWWSVSDTFNAVFAIGDSTIFYPDSQPSEFKYKIQHDSLVIFYDGFISASKISKATGDTLELTSGDDIDVFIKSPR